MSIKIAKNLLEDILKIKEDNAVIGVESEYGPPKTVQTFMETDNSVYLPRAAYASYFQDRPYAEMNSSIEMSGQIKEHQAEVLDQSLEHLQTHHTLLLSLHTGFGKTFLAIQLAIQLKLKTMILVHRVVLLDQWVESIQKFTTAKIQIVSPKDTLEEEADFYIANISYVSKRWDSDEKQWVAKKLDTYSQIGTVIVDEAHIACSSQHAKSFFYFQPKYLMGLSATPERLDGMHQVLKRYIGFSEGDVIKKISQTPFTVYKVATGIKPVSRNNAFGKKDWNSVIESLLTNPQRDLLIGELVRQNPRKTILILTKRVDHCDRLYKLLSERGESASLFYGSLRDYSKTSRVLIATISKAGTGFDDVRFDMLILAISVKEVEQNAGRLRYTPGVDRVIFDLVDKDCNCERHWLDRRKWYLSRNADVRYHRQGEEEETPKRLAPKLNISKNKEEK